tara:strand:+ start:10344 stop:11315 length:972 start_codon:yes stop_codon:yes gene_type:complete
MKILITGCAGFVGHNLSKKLLEDNHHVTGIDNLNNYYDVNLKKNRLKNILNNYKDFKFFKLNLSDTMKTKKFFNSKKFEFVIHLASQAGVRHSIKNPLSYIDNNIIAYINILESVKKKSSTRIIFASSSSVYGNKLIFPLKEAFNTDNQLQMYGVSKKTMELISSAYNNLYNLDIIALRFFTVYGPWGRPDMALFKFVESIIKNKKINVYNYGKHVRDFTYIGDLSESIRLIINKKQKKIIKNKFKIYNIGSNNPISLSKFISIIEKKIGRKAKKNFLPIQQGDIPKTHSDNNKFYLDYGYKPKTSHKKGISNFVDWYLDYYK